MNFCSIEIYLLLEIHISRYSVPQKFSQDFFPAWVSEKVKMESDNIKILEEQK